MIDKDKKELNVEELESANGGQVLNSGIVSVMSPAMRNQPLVNRPEGKLDLPGANTLAEKEIPKNPFGQKAGGALT